MAEDISLIPATTAQFLEWLEQKTPNIAEPSADILANESYRLQYFAQLHHRKEVERLIHHWNAQQETLNHGSTRPTEPAPAAAASAG